MKVRDVLEKVRRKIVPQPQIEGVDRHGVVYAVSAGLDEYGQEVPDPIPMAIPAGMRQAVPTLRDMVQRMIMDQLAAQAHEAGYETFEEADDFDIPDDPPDPATPFEIEFEGLPIMQMRDKEGRLLPPDRIMEELNARLNSHKAREAEADSGSGKSSSLDEGQSTKVEAASTGGSVSKGSPGDGEPKK